MTNSHTDDAYEIKVLTKKLMLYEAILDMILGGITLVASKFRAGDYGDLSVQEIKSAIAEFLSAQRDIQDQQIEYADDRSLWVQVSGNNESREIS